MLLNKQKKLKESITSDSSFYKLFGYIKFSRIYFNISHTEKIPCNEVHTLTLLMTNIP